MTSPTRKLGRREAYMEQIILREQQLLNRKKHLNLLQELRTHAEFEQTEDPSITNKELEYIDIQLKLLSEKKAKLQKCLDGNYRPEEMNHNGVTVESSKKTNTAAPVCVPPKGPAPKDIVALEDLPACPCLTKCPECGEYVMTETFSSISSATWLACCSCALIGCVAGCCLIPFFIDKYKTITHKCPSCQTCIKLIKKL